MIANRELTTDDYLSMLRRRAKVILIPALLAPLAGWLTSFAFAPKFTSQSLVLIEGQQVPENMVQPLVDQDLTSRVATLQQQVLSQSRLQPMVERIRKPGQDPDALIDTIRANMSVEPVETDLSQVGATPTGKKKTAKGSSVPAFYVDYTARSAREAQQICNELTSLMLAENLRFIEGTSQGTSDFLGKQLEDAKHNLDDLDAKLAAFKKQYVGQLPGDAENNLRILTGLNSQLESNTQTLNRAQQDKAYTESLLAQQLAAWKSLQTTSNPQTLQKQLEELQTQLSQLQARYTNDHPDVIKAKADIAEVKKRLAEINSASTEAADTSAEKASATEPGEIRQLRQQVHQYGDVITAATRDQKRLQQEIGLYQGRVSLSPEIEEQYKLLARDYDNGQKNYQDLLADKGKAEITHRMELEQKGEQMHVLNPANLPDAPSFPTRLFFAAGGLGAGLALGFGLAMWLEFRDNSIRTEADAVAALDLPLLVSVPWVGESAVENGNGQRGFWHRDKKSEEHQHTAAS